MAQAPMVESVFVLTMILDIFFLLCIARHVYDQHDVWFTTFNVVAIIQVFVFSILAFDALLLCVDANRYFESQADTITHSKESFQFRMSNIYDSKGGMEAVLSELRITNRMDTMIHMIETRDEPIKLLGTKANGRLSSRATLLMVWYIVLLLIVAAQRIDFVDTVLDEIKKHCAGARKIISHFLPISGLVR